MGGWEVVILDPQLWAKIPERVVVELLSVIWDQDCRDPLSADDVSLEEALYIFLHDGGQGFNFHPFGKVIYADH